MKMLNINKDSTSFCLNYQITYDALPHSSLKQLPHHVKEQMEELYGLIHHHPEQTIAPLLNLIEEYPQVPVFYNFLNVAYEATGQKDKAYAILNEVYRKHPDYLFARTNYAFYCLKNQEPEKVPEIFEYKFDLKLLYPQRYVFHITEFTAFYSVMALYHHAIGNYKLAKIYYKMLREYDPEHKMTKTVRRQLYPTFLQKVLVNLTIKFEDKVEKLTKVLKYKHNSDYYKLF